MGNDVPPAELGLVPIPGFSGYWINDDGDVYSTKFKNGRGGARRHAWLVQRRHPRSGHRRVDIRNDEGCRRTIYVHCLVAWTFIGSQKPGMLTCHSNGDEQDNSPSNLYYGTPKQNAMDRERHKIEAFKEAEIVYVPHPVYGF